MTSPLNLVFMPGGRRVSLMERFRAAARALDLDICLWVSDTDTDSAAWQCADRRVKMPPYGAADFPRQLQRSFPADSVFIPLQDRAIGPLLKAEMHHIGPQDQNSHETCRDKRKTLAFLRGLNLASPPETTVPPAIIRECRGEGSRRLSRAENIHELQKALNGRSELIATRQVCGDEYTIDLYKSLSGEIFGIAPRRRLEVRQGEVQKSRLERHPQLERQARRIATRLNIWGPFCMQCIIDKQGIAWFFDINPRFCGGCILSIEGGADYPLWLLQELCGKIPQAPPTLHWNLKMTRADREFFISAQIQESVLS